MNSSGNPSNGETMSLTRGTLPIVSIVVPFGVYLIGSLLYIWLNQERNYNGDYR